MLQLRSAIFVVEQICPYLDADGRDAAAWHLLGEDGDTLVAYLRVFEPDPDVVIGRVVVAASHRGQGLGHTLMREGMTRAWDRWGPRGIHLSAQAHLEGFYRSLGFAPTGPGYDEDGIPHLPMRCPGPGDVPWSSAM